MKRILTPVLMALLLVASASFASDDIMDLFDVQEHVLDNGMRLLMIEDHSAPIISYMVYYDVGSRNERPGITGMAHMFEHMMFRGSTKYGPEEHANIVKANGGSLNANTWYDRTAYFENISAEHLELVIHLEAERQANLTINEDTFLPEQQVISEERRQRVDNSLYGSAVEELMTNVFRAHPYNWPVIGWMSDIQNYRIEDLQWFHKTYYAPNNAVAIVAGDFDPDEAIELVEKYHGPIPSQPLPVMAKTQEPPQRGERRIEFHRPAQLPFLFAAYHTPAASHTDIPALRVVEKILSDGESSRLYKKCVYEEQVARFAGGSLYELADPGLFMTYIGVNAGRDLEEAEGVLFGTIEDMAVNPVSDTELQKAKNQLEADFYSMLQTNYGKASSLGEACMLYDGDWEMGLRQFEATKNVTADDVMRVVGKYFRPINRTTVILVPDNEVDPVDFSAETTETGEME
ncbi:insulinase family protein [bacterium]|nr:insulinase family protein [bacterium]